MGALFHSTKSIMTVTAQRKTHVILGESFEYDQLKDIAKYGARGGVSGFIYSSELHDKYEEHETFIEDVLEEAGFTMADVFYHQKFETLQQYKEWACWSVLELEALRITDV